MDLKPGQYLYINLIHSHEFNSPVPVFPASLSSPPRTFSQLHTAISINVVGRKAKSL